MEHNLIFSKQFLLLQFAFSNVKMYLKELSSAGITEKRHRGRPCKDIEPMDTAWDDVCLKAADEYEWKEWTAWCAVDWKN